MVVRRRKTRSGGRSATRRERPGRPGTAGDRSDEIAWNRLLTVVLAGIGAFALGALVYAQVAPPATRAAAPRAASSSAASSAGGDGSAATPVLRPDSHRLSTAPDGKVTLVEFLDFECESCGAVYPTIEELRQRYAGRVTFAIRYFPLDGHFNSTRAARAVEAAARQGKLEAMYSKMFTTQAEWGEQQTPMDDRFRGYAADLGLDMARWDADYASPAVAARVQADLDDAVALGLQGTPSFFLNGQPLQLKSAEDLTRALDEALAR